jgi:hypothetical protein
MREVLQRLGGEFEAYHRASGMVLQVTAGVTLKERVFHGSFVEPVALPRDVAEDAGAPRPQRLAVPGDPRDRDRREHRRYEELSVQSA